nr:hypothetical protein [Tanacetum cinerariifolium]
MPIFKRTFSQDLDLLEQHLTKDILSQTDYKTILTKRRTTFENAFNLEFKERMQKYTRFDAQSFKDAMTCNMDSIGKYILEIILHQQRTPHLLKQKKLMQTQEDRSNLFPTLNVDSMKVNLVVIQNTCSKKEDSNSKTSSSKSVKESSLNSATNDVHAIKYKMSKAKERRMAYFLSLHPHLQILSIQDLKGTHIEHGLKRAFDCHNPKQYNRRVNKKQMQMQESKIDSRKAVNDDLVVTKSSGPESEVQDDNSRSGNDTDADDADIKTIYDEDSMVEEKVFAIAALKNDLRKLKGNSVDTKFAKTSVLGKPVLQSLRNQSVVKQPNAFKSERPQIEFVFEKPDHMMASSEFRNSSKNMPRFSSNDMVHNHYLDESRKKTQERDRNSKTSVMPYDRFQSTADGSKPKPRSTNPSNRSLVVSKSCCVTITAMPKADHYKSLSSFSYSKHFVCSTCHKCIFNENHGGCITKLLKEVNSHAKIQSHKTRNSKKPVDQKSHTQKPGRQIFTRLRFSPNKTFAVYEKISHIYDLRWKPTGRIFKFVGLRWIPTGKLFDSCTSKVDNEPPHGSNVDIPNIHECKQTLDVSAELESLFGPFFDEYFNGVNQVVSKSSNVTTPDASDKRQQQLDLTSSTSTLATTVMADGNFNI